MDHSSYYASKYGNYVLGSLNYPLASYENPCAEYLPTQNDPHQTLQQSTSHGYDSASVIVGNSGGGGGVVGGIGAVGSVICNGSASQTATGLSNSNASNATTAATAASIANKVSKLNDATKHFSYADMEGSGSSAANYNNAASMNSYNNGYSSCSKMYENSGATGGAAANALGGASGSNGNAAGYGPNMNYGSYQELNYSGAHAKNANQYYSMPAVTMANPTSNASRTTRTMNAPATGSASNVANESIIHQHQSPRHLAPSQYDGKLAKTSVIKPLNAYSTLPINYSSKYVAPYPSATASHSNNAKSAATIDDATGPMHPSSANNNSDSGNAIRSPAYSVAAGNYKASEVICPEPITRYANHAFPVPTNSNASSGHYLSSNSYAYPNHPMQRHHQGNAVHHSGRSAMHPTAYQAQANEAVSGVGTYYNNPNSLVVRPTPSNYSKCQLTYPNSYNYGAVPTTRSSHHHQQSGGVQRHPGQKTAAIVDADPIGAGSNLVDDGYDRHYHRSYNAMYNTNYLETIYDEYPYQSYDAASTGVAANSAYYHQQQKSMSSSAAAAKAMYGGAYGNGLNMYSGAQQSQPIQSTTTTAASSPSMQSTSVITSTSSSQMISSNYEANAHGQAAPTAVHPIVPNPVYGTNYAPPTSTASAPGSYPCSYMYPPHANSNYVSSAAASKASNAETLPVGNSNSPSGYLPSHHYTYDKASMQHMHPDKYTFIDLEEQINSSKILKAASRAGQHYHHHQKQQHPSAPPAPPLTRQGSGGGSNMMPGSGNPLGAYRKVPHRGSNQQYVYNYNAYNNCYQQQWQPGAGHLSRNNATAAAVAAAAAAADNQKKQNLRDFLSSWNEDEEEGDNEPGAARKSSKANAENAHRMTAHGKRGADASEVAPVHPQPIQLPHKVMPLQGAGSQAPFIQTQHVPPTVIHHDNSSGNAMSMPKIHVGITVDNGSSTHNLPDIIIDIEKPKVSGESECFERTNVIQQGAPGSQPAPPTHQSEKLYILDSIDVPLTDLNKYKHLSVVNKLPDNIVLPSENNEIGVNESLKFIEEVETNHMRFFKNDFESNVEYDDEGKCLLDVSDLVECKNMTTVRNVKRIVRKYRKQREYSRKSKMSSAHRIRAKIAPPAPPTPAPTSLLDEMPATPRPVDLSANRPPTPVSKRRAESMMDLGSQESISSLESLSFSYDDLNDADDATDAQKLDSLKSMCIKTVNTSEFRDFFTENFINRRPKVGAAAVTIPMPVRRPILKPSILRQRCMRIDDEIIDLTDGDDGAVPDVPMLVEMEPMPVVVKPTPIVIKPTPIVLKPTPFVLRPMPIAAQPMPTQIESRVPLFRRHVPLLRHLALRVMQYNQYQMMMNIRSLKLPENSSESEQRPSTHDTRVKESQQSPVPSLKYLALQVANTIYSFNVKPLQDICRLAIEKFDHLFVNRMEMRLMEDEDDAMDIEYEAPRPVEPVVKRSVIWTQRSDATDTSDAEFISCEKRSLRQVKSLRRLAKECIEKQLEEIDNARASASNASTPSIDIAHNEPPEYFNPEPLKVLTENAIVRMNLVQPPINNVEVPSLRNLCESIIMGNGGELPVICFVTDAEDADTTLWQGDSGDAEDKDDDEIYLCLNGDMIEEELAQIVGESVVESPPDIVQPIETQVMQVQRNEIVTAEDAPKLAAIGAKIIPSPVAAIVVPVPEIPTDDYESDDGSSTSRLCLVTDDIQSNIQYEETVPLAHTGDHFMVKIEPFKKYLQNKYVQTSNFFKMMIIQRLLKKYIIYQRHSTDNRAKRAAAVAAVVARRKPKPEKKKKRQKRRSSATKVKRRSKLVKKAAKSAPKTEVATVKPIKIRILKSAESVPIEAEICVNEAKTDRGHSNVSRKSSKSSPPRNTIAAAPTLIAPKPLKSPKTPHCDNPIAQATTTATATPPIPMTTATVAPIKLTKIKKSPRRRFSIATSTVSSFLPIFMPPKVRQLPPATSTIPTKIKATTPPANFFSTPPLISMTKPSKSKSAGAMPAAKAIETPKVSPTYNASTSVPSVTTTSTAPIIVKSPKVRASAAAPTVPAIKIPKMSPPCYTSVAPSTISAISPTTTITTTTSTIAKSTAHQNYPAWTPMKKPDAPKSSPPCHFAKPASVPIPPATPTPVKPIKPKPSKAAHKNAEVTKPESFCCVSSVSPVTIVKSPPSKQSKSKAPAATWTISTTKTTENPRPSLPSNVFVARSVVPAAPQSVPTKAKSKASNATWITVSKSTAIPKFSPPCNHSGPAATFSATTVPPITITKSTKAGTSTTATWTLPAPKMSEIPKSVASYNCHAVAASAAPSTKPSTPIVAAQPTKPSSIVTYVTNQIEKKIAESKETKETINLNDKIPIDNNDKLTKCTVAPTAPIITIDDRIGNNNKNNNNNNNQTPQTAPIEIINIDDDENDKDNENNSQTLNGKSTSITCDILERIAKKRIVKRRQSTIDGYRLNSYDNYNYDTDEDISDMLSSYINRSIEQRPLPPMSLSPISTATSLSASPPPKSSFERAREKLSKSIAANATHRPAPNRGKDPSSGSYHDRNYFHHDLDDVDLSPAATVANPTATATTAATAEASSATIATMGPMAEWKRMKLDKIKPSRTKSRTKATATKHNSQEKKIRDVCREANRYQRNILHRFAKLNFDEILLNINNFYKKLPKAERTSSTSSSSSSSSTSSKSSSSKMRNRASRSSSDSTSSTTSSNINDSSSSSSTWSNAQHRESVQKCVQRPSTSVERNRVRKPIVDMEAMSRQANLCRAYSENIRRNLNLPVDMPDYVMSRYLSQVNDMTSSSSESSRRQTEPFVKLYRSPFIDDLAMKYDRSQQPSSSRKRKLHL